jgi:hyperosmotically inducible protein
MIPNTNLMSRATMLAALATLTLAATVHAASTPTDAWITTKVKISLATSEGTKADDVNVDTVDRMVTLHGTVATADEKAASERVAKSVEGAKSVRNLLQVVPVKNEAAVEEKDEAISAAITASLGKEVSLKNSQISVQSVNKGVVLLMGTAATLSDELTAIDLAGDANGVRRVASEIQSTEKLASAETWMEPNIAVGGAPKAGVRSAATDLYLTSMVKMHLLSNAATPAMEINVDTRAGVVTLFGMVPSAESKAAADAEAKSTAGVASVRNQLQVITAARQPAVAAKDDVVQAAVKKSLGEHSALDQVTSEVTNCVARLTGSVATGAERVEAMQFARATPGVCSVSQDIVVR